MKKITYFNFKYIDIKLYVLSFQNNKLLWLRGMYLLLKECLNLLTWGMLSLENCV